MPELRGAVVAVTGASAGIGWETALAFAETGARLAVCARRLDRLEQLAQAVRAKGGEVVAEAVDVAQADQVRRFVDGAAARFGRLDVLVNNAGYGAHGRVEELPAETFRHLMEVNYLGTVYGCQAAVPIMRRQGRGVIVNVSSIVGHRALAGGAAYAASKAAQISLTESLRAELRGTGVFVSSVHPVGTGTEFAEVAARESGGLASGPIGPQQSARRVAEAIVRCARRPTPEVYPYLPSRALVWLNALSPGLMDRVAWRMARRAGPRVAAAATPASAPITPSQVSGSVGRSSETRNIAKGRVANTAMPNPMATPHPTSAPLSRRTILRTARPSAPRAIRSPISDVRRVTEYASTP